MRKSKFFKRIIIGIYEALIYTSSLRKIDQIVNFFGRFISASVF